MVNTKSPHEVVSEYLDRMETTYYYFPGFTDLERGIRITLRNAGLNPYVYDDIIQEKRGRAAKREIDNLLDQMRSGRISWVKWAANRETITNRMRVTGVEREISDPQAILDEITQLEEPAAKNSLAFYIEALTKVVENPNNILSRGYLPSLEMLAEHFPHLIDESTKLLMSQIKALR